MHGGGRERRAEGKPECAEAWAVYEGGDGGADAGSRGVGGGEEGVEEDEVTVLHGIGEKTPPVSLGLWRFTFVTYDV